MTPNNPVCYDAAVCTMASALSQRGGVVKLGLINSVWSQAGRPIEFGLEKTKQIGFDTVDIAVDPLHLDDGQRRMIERECDRLELPIVSVTCVAVGLIDISPSVRAFHRSRVGAHLELAQEYRARNLLLVIGEYIWNREVVPPQQQWDWAVEALQDLGRQAAERGLEIVLELEPFPLSLINNIDTMVRFLDRVDIPAVKANIDVSHLVLADVGPEELERLKGKAGHVHLSDCNGKVHGDLPPGRGVVPFEPYLRQIKALDFQGAISIELEFPPDPDHVVQWVEEAYEATDRLMRAVALRD